MQALFQSQIASTGAVFLATMNFEAIGSQNTCSSASGFHTHNAHAVTFHMTKSTGPSVGSPKQVIAALEDWEVIFLIPHIDTQREVEGRGDDSLWVHPHGCDGLLVVLECSKLQTMYGEQNQLQPRGQQNHLRAMTLHEVRRHPGVWQEETGHLLYFLE